MKARRPHPRPDRELGAGQLATSFGVLFTLGFLFLAVHTLLHLYTRSVVSAAGADAAVAAAVSDPARCEEVARTRLASLVGSTVHQVECRVDGDDLVVRVEAQSPDVIGAWLVGPASTSIEREFRIRVEEFVRP